MSKFKRDIILRIVKLLDVVLITIPFFACWYMYYADRVASPYYAKGNYLIIALFFILYVVLGRVYDAFLVSLTRISEVIYSQSLAAGVADLIMYIVIWLLTKHLPNILPLLAALGLQILMAACWAYEAHQWYFHTFPPLPTAIIYDERKGMNDLINAYGLDKNFKVERTASARECLNNLSILDGMHNVFLSGVRSHDRNVIIKYCIENNLNVFVIPRIGDVIMSGARAIHMFHLPMLHVSRYNASPEYLLFKRFFDIILSSIALFITSPIFLITSIAIKMEDGGPVFYKQKRLTKDRKEFNIVKFRSMCVDAEKDGVARLSTGDKDDRITKVGKVIRSCRIDELPQLLQIFSGDMTIVGPRPERPEIATQYEKLLPEFSLRLQVKAGLTGYAQVYGKYNTMPYDKLQMDLMYIAHPGIIQDIKIILATIKILFMKESTEGVAEGQTTADSGKPEIKESVGQESMRKTV